MRALTLAPTLGTQAKLYLDIFQHKLYLDFFAKLYFVIFQQAIAAPNAHLQK
jgi:hypothetical protein